MRVREAFAHGWPRTAHNIYARYSPMRVSRPSSRYQARQSTFPVVRAVFKLGDIPPKARAARGAPWGASDTKQHQSRSARTTRL